METLVFTSLVALLIAAGNFQDANCYLLRQGAPNPQRSRYSRDAPGDFGAATLRGPSLNSSAEQKRVAVIVSGMAERIIVTPLLVNVVGLNARAGVTVDVFYRICAPKGEEAFGAGRHESKWLKAEAANRYTMDGKVMQALGEEKRMETLLEQLCHWAYQEGANRCYTEAEFEEPLVLPDDSEHRNVITYYNPITTVTGQALLNRWRSIEYLWRQALKVEASEGFKYNSVLVVRDDDYFLGAYPIDVEQFEEEPALVRTIDCLESHGLNDKTMHMGRQAAELLGAMYTVWSGEQELAVQGSRNAEEYVYRRSMAHGVCTRPQGLPMSVAVMTTSGLPCFRKQRFNLTVHGGYAKCYGEKDDQGPLTKLFRAFNCDDLYPAYFEQLSVENVSTLHDEVQKAVGISRQPLILTIADNQTLDMTFNMLRSLKASAERAPCLVVGMTQGVCGEVAAQGFTNPCLELALRFRLGSVQREKGQVHYSEAARQKHAILTMVTLSGFSEGILFVEPDVVFLRPPMAMFREQASHKDLVFAMNNAVGNISKTCEEVSERYVEAGGEGLPSYKLGGKARLHADEGLFYVSDAPGAAHVLLQAWVHLVEEGDLFHAQGWAIQRALAEINQTHVGVVPCDQFVNGNVFWGHREMLDLARVHSVHATWMNPSQQKQCLKQANLWHPREAEAENSNWWPFSKAPARLGPDGVSVLDCGSSIAT